MNGVTITTGARLHFGPLSVAAPAGGRFGGVGVMIENPRIVLRASRSSRDSVDADPDTAARVQKFLQKIRESIPETPACTIQVEGTIPSHQGFGSGTQLGLAVARAASLLAGRPEPSLEALARCVGRGLRSAVGLHGFMQGGFLVDGGRYDVHRLGTLVARVDFPSDWRFVIAAPRETVGLSGEAEQSAFARQPPMPTALTSDLCRIVLMDWLPAVVEQDFGRCSEAMFNFGHAVGEFFSPAQGGVFAHPRMAAWTSQLQQRGIQGIAQTSWGPTVVALCQDQSTADQLQRDFASDAKWSDCDFSITAPLNHGAQVGT